MRGIIAITAILLSPLAMAERCQPEAPTDLKLYSTDLRWNQPLAEMKERYERIYSSGKRLPRRAYRDAATGALRLPHEDGTIAIPEEFVAAVRTHIEKALRRKYADAVFFSDLGHSHVLIPEQKHQEHYRHIGSRADFYTQLFKDRDIRFLYHTAEQLQTAEQLHTAGSDPHLAWRQNTRNLVGENRPDGEVHVEPGYHERAHTLRDVAGYHWYSAGFNLSASRDGCFPFITPTGETRYFDLSLYDLTSEEGTASLFGVR